ncbi:uncharacterized protein I206_101110 [Kwoniella pini CBS 10737]|uniref:Uncharacterized protein n=1 Tax=Kwoniella pini CBS 10737 TaxID=1296096 RepID=A0A1B9IB81_9TREE|nr:uncharacterized protein I206_00216 [Kwoniella pini CBS 10737]OCF52915.1 hypothetical protein I206_00216 [Kwoniella pini CBS 10737]
MARPVQGYSPPQQPIVPRVQPSVSSIPLVGSYTGASGVTPSILPGPFILLIILPLIPLLLFSLGARPPNTSNLPFSNSDIFTTGAFLTITMIIVICLGVYPEAGGAVWEFIKDGKNVQSEYLKKVKMLGGLVGDTPQHISNSHELGKMEWIWKWTFDEKYKRWIKIKVLAPVRQGHITPNHKGIHNLASKHLNTLRNTFPNYYSEYKPKLIHSLLFISFGIFISILLIGEILNSAYEKDLKNSSSSSSSDEIKSNSSSWVEREIRKRKKEKPEETLNRIKIENKKEIENYKKLNDSEKFEKFQKKREAEIEILKKELKKRKLPLIGLDEKKKKDKKSKKEEKKSKEEDDELEKKDKGKSRAEKVKRLLSGKKATKKSSSEDIGKAGPGWEIADPSLAQNTLAKSEMNAQQMAAKLKAGG